MNGILMEVEFSVELACLDLIHQFICDANHSVDELGQHRGFFHPADPAEA